MEESKRVQAVLIPYQIREKSIFVFLQKRSITQRLPNYYGFFGGHLENDETPEEGMLREIKEELDYTPKNYQFLKAFEFTRSIRNVYYMRAEDDFEKQITVLEGQYGKYFKEDEALSEPLLIDEDKEVLQAFYKKIKGALH